MLTIVLAGGGARGIAHLGVLKRFEENNIIPDFIVGTSMGSIIGGVYSLYADSSFVINNMYYLLKKIKNFKVDLDAAFTGKVDFNKYMGSIICQFGALKKYISSPKKYKKALKLIFENYNIEDTKIDFMAIATDLKSTKPIKIKNGNLSESVFTSSTLPGFFPSVKKDDMLLVDGGVTANLPVMEAKEERPENKIIAIDLNSNTTLQTSQNAFSIMASIDILKEKIINDVERSHADYIIDIDVSKINIGDFTRYREAIREGYRQSKKHIKKIKELLR